MEIVHEKRESPNVLVRELHGVNCGVVLNILFLDGEVSDGIIHPLIIDLRDEAFVKAIKKNYGEDGFGNLPFGLLIKKEELAKSPSPLFEHDLLLWFV
ncbi:hypothetical protein AGMMS49928_07390 [Spirochaetia bacterium]|nr:hypothetical protein AGMMS49928_07390 [Spirochaetia bacterium]